MERVGEDTVVSVEEGDDEEGENGSTSKLGGCPNLNSRTERLVDGLLYEGKDEARRTIRRVMM